jgi:hypothetical protein
MWWWSWHDAAGCDSTTSPVQNMHCGNNRSPRRSFWASWVGWCAQKKREIIKISPSPWTGGLCCSFSSPSTSPNQVKVIVPRHYSILFLGPPCRLAAHLLLCAPSTIRIYVAYVPPTLLDSLVCCWLNFYAASRCPCYGAPFLPSPLYLNHLPRPSTPFALLLP